MIYQIPHPEISLAELGQYFITCYDILPIIAGNKILENPSIGIFEYLTA